MRWEQGRGVIEDLLVDGHLQRVPASRAQADLLIGQARTHVASAGSIAAADPPGAYQLCYDGARKALVAVLENQGLRPTSRGGHVAVYEAVSAQLDPPLGKVLAPFNRMRRRRHDSEYPSVDQPAVDVEEVEDDLPKAADIIAMAERVLDRMDVF
jgi:hypothetical protein